MYIPRVSLRATRLRGTEDILIGAIRRRERAGELPTAEGATGATGSTAAAAFTAAATVAAVA